MSTTNTEFPRLTETGPTPKITSIFDFSPQALGELQLWLSQNPPSIPITQIIGFQNFTAVVAPTIQGGTHESTTSSTFTTLATAGPTLTGLSPGKYLVFFGAIADSTVATNSAVMGVSVNDAAVDGNFVALTTNVGDTSIGVAGGLTVSAANTSIAARYRNNDAVNNATFLARWLFVLRYANIS